MAQADGAETGTAVERHEHAPRAAGVAVVSDDRVQNPGFPPYRPRVSDVDPVKERQNERRIFWLFLASMVGRTNNAREEFITKPARRRSSGLY